MIVENLFDRFQPITALKIFRVFFFHTLVVKGKKIYECDNNFYLELRFAVPHNLGKKKLSIQSRVATPEGFLISALNQV